MNRLLEILQEIWGGIQNLLESEKEENVIEPIPIPIEEACDDLPPPSDPRSFF